MGKNIILWVGISVVVVIVAVVLLSFQGDEDSDGTEGQVNGEGSQMTGNATSGDLPSWMTTELTDVTSGERYMIADFLGTPLLVESFAVWCPSCTAQQENVLELHEGVGDEIISISLDTDPDEDENIVREHIQEHGFTWRYSIAPIEMTQSLVDEFGQDIVTAPFVPMILVCPDGSYEQLSSGVKSVSTLKNAVDNCPVT